MVLLLRMRLALEPGLVLLPAEGELLAVRRHDVGAAAPRDERDAEAQRDAVEQCDPTVAVDQGKG